MVLKNIDEIQDFFLRDLELQPYGIAPIRYNIIELKPNPGDHESKFKKVGKISCACN